MIKITDEIKKLIEHNALAFATVDSSGNPHCIAVGFAKVIDDNKILITDNFMAQTTINIKKNNNIALAVWSRNWEDDCKGYELRGKAEYFNTGEWFDQVKAIDENKNMSCKGAILVIVEKIKYLS